jgi:hypothetical protein
MEYLRDTQQRDKTAVETKRPVGGEHVTLE